ncbi:MAG TPA: DUF4058 family protein, partial [Ardenticatenaceae bacterium]
VQGSLTCTLREQLTPLIVPTYFAELHTRVIVDPTGVELEHMPSVFPVPRMERVPEEPIPSPVRLLSIHIRFRENKRLVTVIEVLSPVNKRPGAGRDEYLEKRASLLDSNAHLIEIDLLRRWPRMPLEGALPDTAYLIMVSAAYERPHCDVWPIGLQNPLPTIPIPLLRPDPPVPLNIGAALDTAYERARYDLRIDYGAPPVPQLSPEDEAWRAALLAERAE